MTPDTRLKRVPLHQAHLDHGAKMVPFAGYEMPVQYRTGVLKEHQQTRAAAGLFDVSHMGQIAVRPRSGNMMDAALALERIVPADIVALAFGRQRYSQFTVPGGGIFDDLMIANFGTHYVLVVNASRKQEDESLIRGALEESCEIEVLNDRALIALQGPLSEEILTPLAPAIVSMRFMDVRKLPLLGISCMISRSGYTGEDGFEISAPAPDAIDVWVTLLRNAAVQPIGLGARDSLRLEAGLCLYGNDIDLTTSPVEASLEWSIQKSRRIGGERAGGFPGAETVLSQLQALGKGVGPERRLVGFRPEIRPIRAGVNLFKDKVSPEPIGYVTSGGFGPTVNGPISMGYVARNLTHAGTTLYAEVRGERHALTVANLPFVAHRYKR